ncbi:hypothetical protein U1Q18_022538 [Sarracenia purpurea var. burkii]
MIKKISKINEQQSQNKISGRGTILAEGEIRRNNVSKLVDEASDKATTTLVGPSVVECSPSLGEIEYEVAKVDLENRKAGGLGPVAVKSGDAGLEEADAVEEEDDTSNEEEDNSEIDEEQTAAEFREE